MPSNWRQVNDGNSVWFVPEGAYGQYNGQAVYTHGASFGVAQTNNRNLQSATQELVNSLAQGNNNLRSSSGYQRTTLSGRNALFSTLSNVNEATGRPETVRLVTTQLRNGQLFYMIAVAPQNERGFNNAFEQIMQICNYQRLENQSHAYKRNLHFDPARSCLILPCALFFFASCHNSSISSIDV